MATTGIVCLQCSGATLVTDSRQGRGDDSKSYTRRRRKCVDCDFRFTTFESTSLKHRAVSRNMQQHIDAVDILMRAVRQHLSEIEILMRHSL